MKCTAWTSVCLVCVCDILHKSAVASLFVQLLFGILIIYLNTGVGSTSPPKWHGLPTLSFPWIIVVQSIDSHCVYATITVVYLQDYQLRAQPYLLCWYPCNLSAVIPYCKPKTNNHPIPSVLGFIISMARYNCPLCCVVWLVETALSTVWPRYNSMFRVHDIEPSCKRMRHFQSLRRFASLPNQLVLVLFM